MWSTFSSDRRSRASPATSLAPLPAEPSTGLTPGCYLLICLAQNEHPDSCSTPERRRRPTPPHPPLRSAPSDRAEHDEHDRRRPLHHDPAPHVRARRPTGDARLDRGAHHRRLRRHGLERARRGHAGIRGFVRLPARGVRPGARRASHGLPLRLAVRAERPARDRVGLHRLRRLRHVHLERAHQAAGDRVDHGRGRHQHRAALPAHPLHRQNHDLTLDRHARHGARRHRDGRLALQSQGRLRFSARRVQLHHRVLPRARCGLAHRDLRLPRLLRHLLHRRRSARSGARDSAVDSHQHGGRGGHLPGDQPLDRRRGAVARLRAGGQSPRVELHRVHLHAANLRRAGGRRVHAARALDRVRLRVRAAPGLLANPLCRRRERLLLPRVRPAASHQGVSIRVASRAWRALDPRRLLRTRHGDRRAARLDLRLRHDTGARDPVRRWRAAAGLSDISRVVVASPELALRHSAGGIVKIVWRALVFMLVCAGAARAQNKQMLHSGWLIQSSARAGTDGARISTSRYVPRNWYRATVPSTVVGTLVDDGVYRDPFFGMNLRSLPGMTYKIGANFVHTAMSPNSPFAVAWWYRTTFRTPAGARGRHVTLGFDGINYRANIWLNGRRLADSSQVAGTYRRYELDVTDALAARGANVLAIEIFAPTPPDLQTT